MTRFGHAFAFVTAASMISAVAASEWTMQTSGSRASLRGISVVNERVAWASGSGGTVLRTTDGGATWSALGVPGAERLDFRDVDAVSATTAYILSIGNGDASRIYKTTDGGATWQMQFQNEDPAAFFDAMAFADVDHGIAVSDASGGKFVILMTTNGGRAWTRVPPDRLPEAQENEGFFAASGTNVTMLDRNHVWFGTGAAERARVGRSADGGRTWRVVETPIRSGDTAGIYSIAFRDAMNGIVVGGAYNRESEAIDNIAVTRDGGATWSLVTRADGASALSGFRSVVAYVPGTTTILAVGPAGADMSTDDGRTWAPVPGPGFHTFDFVPGATTGWGAGSGGRIAKWTTSR